jgi:hypothetical protein
VLLPEVPALEVVLAHPAPDAHVVDCLFVDELDALVFREHRFEPLQYFFAGESGEGASEVLIIEEL